MQDKPCPMSGDVLESINRYTMNSHSISGDVLELIKRIRIHIALSKSLT
jgi:hypothetical protein